MGKSYDKDVKNKLKCDKRVKLIIEYGGRKWLKRKLKKK